MTSDDKFLSRVVSLGGLVDAAMLIGLSATWIGLLGDLWWFFDLFSHFRFQCLGISVFALAWFIWRMNWGGITASFASVLVNAALFFGFFAGGAQPGPTAPGFRFRALSINVHTSNRAFGKVIDFVRKADADVVLLLEIDKRWKDALAPLEQLYPHSRFEPRRDNFGVAFFSRDEVVSSEVEVFADPSNPDEIGVPGLVVVIRHGGKTIRVIGAHPLPPTGPGNSRWRNDELSKVAEMATRSREPVLLIGDLNATPWSAGMRVLTRQSALRLPPAKFQREPSWMVTSPLAIPIDHALATLPLVVLRRDVGPDVGSDHVPIIAELGWR